MTIHTFLAAMMSESSADDTEQWVHRDNALRHEGYKENIRTGHQACPPSHRVFIL